MTDERKTLGSGDMLSHVSRVVGIEDAIPELGQFGQIKEGFGSIVFVTPGNEGVAIKIPKVGSAGLKSMPRVLMGLENSGVECRGSFLITSNRVEPFDLVTPDKPTSEAECAVDAQLVLLLLEKMSGDTEVLQLLDTIPPAELVPVYFQAGKRTRELHDRKLPETVNVEAWRAYSVAQIVSGDERFDSIVTFLKNSFPEAQLSAIREKMVQVKDIQLAQSVGLSVVHGDNWEGNWRYNETDDGAVNVQLFDPALAYGPKGLDAGFAVGKQLIRWLVSDDFVARESVEAFFDGYGRDDRFDAVLAEVWNPLVFKMAVGAAFDGYQQSVCEQLLSFSDRLLTYKIDNPRAVFSLELAQTLWNESRA